MPFFFESGLFTTDEIKEAARNASAADKIRAFFSKDMFCNGLIMRSPTQYFEINSWMKVRRGSGINGNDVLKLWDVNTRKAVSINVPVDEALDFHESGGSVTIRFDGNVKYSFVKIRPVGGSD